ncbi:lactonase family protein [Photobacterium swingsii]|uniref:lactonase family protein n=1 Tax=Photobacterium swingsii TaxID=680026 RepID=UPI004069624E
MMTSHCLHYYVGTYTDSPSTSTGIARITLNPDSGELTRLEDVTALRNPSYLTVTQVGLYSVSEVSRDEGALVQFTSPLSSRQLAIAGDSPCHLAIKPPYLAVANYGSGNTSLFLLDEKGQPQRALSELYIAGSGTNPDRQRSPHAHQVCFFAHSNQLAVVDLGADQIHIYDYRVNAPGHKFTLTQTIPMPAGSGPRHLVFNKSETLAYLVCELSETVITLLKEQNKWHIVHQCDLLKNVKSEEAASAIQLSDDDRFLYVSCRAQNKICLFDVSAIEPIKIAEYDSGGAFPRDFTLSCDGLWLLVANQHSDNIVSFRRNRETGELTPTGYQCTVSVPVCLQPVREYKSE